MLYKVKRKEVFESELFCLICDAQTNSTIWSKHEHDEHIVLWQIRCTYFRINLPRDKILFYQQAKFYKAKTIFKQQTTHRVAEGFSQKR